MIAFGTILITTVLGTTVFASQNVKILVNGKQIISDVSPQIVNGRVMVPISFVARALGANVDGTAVPRQYPYKRKATAQQTPSIKRSPTLMKHYIFTPETQSLPLLPSTTTETKRGVIWLPKSMIAMCQDTLRMLLFQLADIQPPLITK